MLNCTGCCKRRPHSGSRKPSNQSYTQADCTHNCQRFFVFLIPMHHFLNIMAVGLETAFTVQGKLQSCPMFTQGFAAQDFPFWLLLGGCAQSISDRQDNFGFSRLSLTISFSVSFPSKLLVALSH